jgi:PiT family inorganic phosphate transporter
VELPDLVAGIATSSSHALIGGIAGAGIAKAGFSNLDAASIQKTVLFIPLSPVIGLVLGFGLMLISLWTFRRTSVGKVDGLFRRLQLLSAAAFSLGTAATTRRRPWASSPRCWWAPGTSSSTPTGTFPCRCGSSCRRMPPSRSARCRADGAS